MMNELTLPNPATHPIIQWLSSIFDGRPAKRLVVRMVFEGKALRRLRWMMHTRGAGAGAVITEALQLYELVLKSGPDSRLVAPGVDLPLFVEDGPVDRRA